MIIIRFNDYVKKKKIIKANENFKKNFINIILKIIINAIHII